MPDILLVTVTKVETKTVLQVFEQATKQKAKPNPIADLIYWDLGRLNCSRAFLVQSGLGAALQTVTKGIEAVSPVAVIMIGIAFGVNEAKQTIGDARPPHS